MASPRILLPRPWDGGWGLAADRDRFAVLPLLTLQIHEVPEPPPGRPAYLLFTSQNGVRAALQQPWFDAAWWAIPAYAVGAKTADFIQRSGLNLAHQGPPPAQDFVAHLPAHLGLWVSGAEVAHDLSGPLLQRHILYDFALDPAMAAQIREGGFTAACLPSARLIREVAALCPALTQVSVLSERLASAARPLFPDAKIAISPTLKQALAWHVGT